MTNNVVCLRWNSFETNIAQNLEALWCEERLTDVTIYCSGQKLHAHQMILSACSPFFTNLFQGTQSTDQVVLLPEFQIVTVRNLLNFIYKGEVYIEEQHLTEFLQLAEELKIKGLCGKKMLPIELESGEEHNNETQTKVPTKRRRRHSKHDFNIPSDAISLEGTTAPPISSATTDNKGLISDKRQTNSYSEPVNRMDTMNIPTAGNFNNSPNPCYMDLSNSTAATAHQQPPVKSEINFSNDQSNQPPYFWNLPYVECLPPPETLIDWYKDKSLDQLACNLMKTFFTIEERISCNVNGKMGKPQFNVDKMKLIKEVVRHYSCTTDDNLFEEQWKICVTKIDTTNRGLKRKFIVKGMLL